MPIEQVNTSEEPTYFHHDQQGSTRLLTNHEGKNVGAYAYAPYGKVEEHTGTATTPLGYDAQYTSTDTGLIYLRERVYDPATAQFLTIDPALPTTNEPYAYTEDNPLDHADPTGRGWFSWLWPESTQEWKATANWVLVGGATVLGVAVLITGAPILGATVGTIVAATGIVYGTIYASVGVYEVLNGNTQEGLEDVGLGVVSVGVGALGVAAALPVKLAALVRYFAGGGIAAIGTGGGLFGASRLIYLREKYFWSRRVSCGSG